MATNSDIVNEISKHGSYETGHAKNVANFEKMVDFCVGYGTTYNPSKTTIKVAALQTLLTNAKNAILAVNTNIPAYSNAVAARELAFEPLSKLVTKIINSLKATDTYYALGYSDFTLDYYCDGYIYQNPFKDYQPITMEKDFITNENLNELKLWLLCIRPEDSEWQKEVESLTMENVNDWLFEDIRKHFAHLIK